MKFRAIERKFLGSVQAGDFRLQFRSMGDDEFLLDGKFVPLSKVPRVKNTLEVR